MCLMLGNLNPDISPLLHIYFLWNEWYLKVCCLLSCLSRWLTIVWCIIGDTNQLVMTVSPNHSNLAQNIWLSLLMSRTAGAFTPLLLLRDSLKTGNFLIAMSLRFVPRDHCPAADWFRVNRVAIETHNSRSEDGNSHVQHGSLLIIIIMI